MQPLSPAASLYQQSAADARRGLIVLLVDATMPYNIFGGLGERVDAMPGRDGGILWRCRASFAGLNALGTAADAIYWLCPEPALPQLRIPLPASPEIEILRQTMADCARFPEVPVAVLRTIESLAVAASQA